MAQDKLECNMDSNLLEQLSIALTLNKEELDDVISN